MTTIRYPDKVWKAIKRLWEVSPKATSLQTILNQVAETLECEVPSVQAVTVKIKREKWKKLSAKALKKSVDFGVESQQDLNSKNSQENDSKTNNYKEVINSENNIEIIGKKMELVVHAKAGDKLSKIESLRKQAWNVFNITQSAIDGLAEYIAKLETTDFSQADEQDLKVLTFELSVFEKMVNIANTASMVNERNTKMLIGLHGLDFDDFKDKQAIEQQRTAQLLKLDNLLEEKRLLMAEQQKQAFERNLAAIEDKMRSG